MPWKPKSPSMNPGVLISFCLLLILVAACGGCVRNEDRETGSADGLFPEPSPEIPTVSVPREPPTLPTLPLAWSGSSAASRSIPLPEHPREG